MFTLLQSRHFFFQSPRTLVRHMIVPMAVALVLSLTIPSALAQRYSVFTPKLNDKEAKSLWRVTSQAVNNAAAFQTDKSKIDEYFMKYYFPLMTQYDPKNLGELGERREDLVKWLREAKVPEAQEHLTGLTLKAERIISRGNFHPAVRYNAALIVGLLDKEYATAPPVPLPEGTLALLELLEQNEFALKDKKVKVPASVKAAALVGLERHARFGISAEYTDRVTKASLAAIADTEPEEEVSKSVHHWMKCMAARVLVRQYAEGPTVEVQASLTGLISDDKMGLEDRCCAAELLEKINYQAAAGIDGTAAMLALGQLAQDVLEDEAKESEEFEKEALEKGPTSNRGGFGRLHSEDDGPKYPRRRLLNRLTCITRGSKSLANGLADEAKQNLHKLVDSLKPTISVVADKDSGNLDIAGAVKDLKTEINALVNSWKPAEAEAAEEG
jgi:hypothetical protein